ncbi:Stk19 family serine/threonine-protein kinase, partial [Aspergillus thermomutatus]
MPLRITSAPVSGIQKRKRPSPFKPRASPFAGHARQKAAVQSSRPDQLDELYPADFDQGQLPDLGTSHYVPQTAPVEDVIQAIHYIRDKMFEDIPARAGMNSTRIAEVLNLRRSLPPLASVAHVHTLIDAPTKVEKEIVDLVNAGRIRRLIVPGRGNDAAGLGDCLVLTEDWERLVRESSVLEVSVKDKFLQVLRQIGNISAIPASFLSQSERMDLVRAGFLVSSSSLVKGSIGVASLPGLPSSTPAPAPASASRSGNFDQSCDTPDNQHLSLFQTATLFLSLPNTGPYLRLLGAGRKHLLALLNKSSSGEAPVYLLRDRWDGAVETDKSFSVAKRVRGEFAGILPGKTRKWKELYGMNFRWALEEALGAGLIETFDTGSVGPA